MPYVVPKDQIERVFHTHENAACDERSVRQKSGNRPTNYGNETIIIRGSNCVIEPEKCGVPANKSKHWKLQKLETQISVENGKKLVCFSAFFVVCFISIH